MDRPIIRKLFEYDFYSNNKQIILRDFFSNHLALIYDTLIRAHEKYKADLKMEWVKALHYEHNSFTAAQVTVVDSIFDQLSKEDIIPSDIAADLINKMYTRASAQDVINIGMKIINGQTHDLSELSGALTTLRSESPKEKSYDRVDFDLDTLLEGISDDNLFPFRLQCLREKVYGAGRGNFIIVFARPEAGKTTYCSYEVGGYLKQGLRVGYFGNEEPAFRTYLRMICSTFEVDVMTVEQNKEKYKKEFEEYSKNLFVYNCVGMNINEVDIWAAEFEPDVIVLDQLDKFYTNDTYSRDDLRLGSLYTHAREIAKRRNCLMYAVSQCSADGDGLAAIDFSMLAGAKTSKGAEADVVIGIGSTSHLQEDNKYRQFNLSKNKINGWHGSVTAVLEAEKAIFTI